MSTMSSLPPPIIPTAKKREHDSVYSAWKRAAKAFSRGERVNEKSIVVFLLFLNYPLNSIYEETGCAANPGLACCGLATVGRQNRSHKHGQGFLLFNELQHSNPSPWGKALKSHKMKIVMGLSYFFEDALLLFMWGVDWLLSQSLFKSTAS